MKVLVVDDDPGIRTSLGRVLSFEGYEVISAPDGVEGLARVRSEDPDLVILDLSMPHAGGLDVCRALRSEGDRRPLLVLTARHGVSDRVAGLDAGADDYLVKPFALEELLARVRALLRRSTGTDARPSGLLVVGDLTLDRSARTVSRGNRPIEVTRTEFDLLELLMSHPGQVLTQEQISDHVWGYDGGTANSLPVYIGYLRRKTEQGGEPRVIQTVRGVGFVLRATGPEPA